MFLIKNFEIIKQFYHPMVGYDPDWYSPKTEFQLRTVSGFWPFLKIEHIGYYTNTDAIFKKIVKLSKDPKYGHTNIANIRFAF